VLKRLEDKTGGSKRISHTEWSGARGYLRKGTRRKGVRNFTYQPTVDKTIGDMNKLLIEDGSVDDS
jgi:hypothetical protein